MPDERQYDHPVDRLTRLCAVMTDALEAAPEYTDDVRCIVFMNDAGRGGIQLHGYDDMNAGISDLLVHLRAMFRASGKRMDIAFANEDGIDWVDG